MYIDDTIAAVATPPGRGAVGIVRISGPAAAAIVAGLFRANSTDPVAAPRRLCLGRVIDAEGRVVDESLCAFMPGPNSYTGEDIAEIHSHGAPVVLRQVLQAALARGARVAQPGELTRRAFLNGRMDLIQAEAVDDLIQARGQGQARLALQQLAGGLSAELGLIRDRLIDLKGLLEAQIDFAEEELDIDSQELGAIASECHQRVQAMAATFEQGRLIRDGARAAIVGKPNVGKSSLLNALLGQERAIVTDIAGTTRDVIEEAIEIDGILVQLADTAGLRDADDADPIERLGIDRSRAQLRAADCAIVVLDGARPLAGEDRQVLAESAATPRVVAVNKTDLAARLDRHELAALVADAPVVSLSAVTGAGLPELRRRLARVLGESGPEAGDPPPVSRLRHRDALAKAAVALAAALESLDARRPPDLVAVDVQEALDQIGEITGVITHEDVLDRIFSRFCLGK